MCDNNHRHYYQHQKKLLSLDYLHTKKMTTSTACKLTWLIYKSAKKRIIRSQQKRKLLQFFSSFIFGIKLACIFSHVRIASCRHHENQYFLRTTTACWYYCHCGVIMLIMHDMMIITLFPPPYKHFLFVSAFYQHYHRKCIVTGNKTSYI